MTLDLDDAVKKAESALLRQTKTGVLIRKRESRDLAEFVLALAKEVRAYQRALVEHHAIHNLSDDVIRDSLGRTCQVCVRALSRLEGGEA